jgi:hypothetical protein
LKGTPVREKYLEHDYVFDPQPPYQIIQSKYLSKEELYQITQLEFALEAYWNKKRIIHTLKYVTNRYSCFDFLLGIGIAFELKYDYHKHTLMNIYEVAHQYIKQNLFYTDVFYMVYESDIDHYRTWWKRSRAVTQGYQKAYKAKTPAGDNLQVEFNFHDGLVKHQVEPFS